MARPVLQLVWVNPAVSGPALSSGFGPGAASGVGPVAMAGQSSALPAGAVAVDLDGMRRQFPARWAAFLRAHFQGPLHVAMVFSVDERAARNWWEGVTAPRAEAAIAAVAAYPQALPLFLGVAA
jgi:hypothetical protein